MFIGTIRLQPQEHWQEVVNFLTPEDDADVEEALDISELFRQQINGEWERRERENDPNQELVEVDANLLARANALFTRRFNLTRGEYELFLAALDRKNRVLGVAKLKFILYEGMIGLLRNVTNDYKYGWGVIDALAEGRRWPEPRLTLIGSGSDIKREYESMLKAEK